MSHGHPGLTPYQAAYLAGGPARVTDTATVELIRRGALALSPAGLAAASVTVPSAPGGPAVLGLPGAGRDPQADEVEQLILGLAGSGLPLAALRRRCGPARPVRQIGTGLAAAGLVFSPVQRRVAAGLALLLLAAGAAAGVAIAAGWQVAPTARGPLAAAAAVIVAGLLARARQRTTAAGRGELADAAGLARQLTAQLPPAPDPDGTGLSASDVANVALRGLAAVPDAGLRARLGGRAG